MASCTMRLTSAAKGAPVPRNPLTGSRVAAINHALHAVTPFSIACKMLCTNVLFRDGELYQGLISPRDHAWRPSNVVNRLVQLTDMFGKQLRVDRTGCP